MPRATWLAVGSALCALLAVDGPALLAPGEPTVGATGVSAALLGGSLALAAAGVGMLRRSPAALAAAGGAALVAVRLLIGTLEAAPQSPPLPSSLDRAVAQVVSVSTPSGGVQRAVISVDGAGTQRGGASAESAAASAGSGARTSGTPRPSSVAALRLYARLPRYPEVMPGDLVEVSGSVRPPPEEPGFGDYLRRSGIAGTVTARTVERVPAPVGPAAWLEARRRDAGEILATVLPAPQAGLASGILVGLRDEVDRDVAASFTAAGLTHIVAISGWNIAVVSAMLATLLRRAPRRRRSVGTLIAILAYTAAAGAGASVVRAAAMAAVVLGSRELGRPGTAASALGLAVAAMLLVEPSVVGDAGFQLSVAATAGLLAWGTPLTTWLRARLSRGGSRLRAPDWLIDSLGVSLAAQAVTLPLILLDFGRVSLVSPVANLLAAPLVVPVMAVSAAALVVGWAGTLAGAAGSVAAGSGAVGSVAAGSGAAIAAGLPAPLGILSVVAAWMVGLTGAAGGFVIGLLVTVARLTGSMPGASVTLGPPVQHVLAIVSAVAVGSVAVPAIRSRLRNAARRVSGGSAASAAGERSGGARPRAAATRAAGREAGASGVVAPRTPTRAARATGSVTPWLRRVLLLAGGSGLALVLVAASRPDGRAHLTVFDVGQGDAVLLQGPSGGRILVDAGPDPERLVSQLDALVPAWDRRLDLLVLTHPHEDHVAGAALLLRRYRVGRIVQPGMLGNGPGWEALEEAAAAQNRPLGTLAAGDALDVDGVDVRVLWPKRGEVPKAPGKTGTAVNNISIVLDVRYGERRFVLTGDAEQEVDAALLAAGAISSGQPRVDVLKVAHHGSRTASTAAFLEAARPAVAVISVGAGNDFGHPAPATLDRLGAAGARVFRTDLDGSVGISTDGRDLVMETTRGRWRWELAPANRARPSHSSPSSGETARWTGQGASLSAPGPPGSRRDGVEETAGLAGCRTDRRGGAALHRIGSWFPQGRKRPTSCSSSIRRTGSSHTPRPLPRSRRSSPSAARRAEYPSTANSSRRPRCCTTSTSSCPGTIRCRNWGTAPPGLGGSASAATRSSGARSRRTPSRGSSTRTVMGAGTGSRRAKSASSRMPTSVPASASRR